MEHKDTQINELYPILPEWTADASRCAPRSVSTAAPPLDGGQSYRLQKITEIQSVLEDEREKNVIILAKNIIKQLKSSVI